MPGSTGNLPATRGPRAPTFCASRLRRGAVSVLHRPDFRGLPGAARLPRTADRPPVLRPRGGGGAAVPVEPSPRSAEPGLNPRAAGTKSKARSPIADTGRRDV
jgi:hypothetical protein